MEVKDLLHIRVAFNHNYLLHDDIQDVSILAVCRLQKNSTIVTCLENCD
jgi:hypothetical protein